MEDSNMNAEATVDGGSTTESSSKAAHPPREERIQKLLDKALYAGGSPVAQEIRNFLNGTWLGEPLHVVLKDLPIGAWTVAILFDVLDLTLDRREFALAADTSIAIGLVGAAGAAATGMTDWSDVDPPARRLGLIHGLLNLGGTALFATSLLFEKKAGASQWANRCWSWLRGYRFRCSSRRQDGVRTQSRRGSHGRPGIPGQVCGRFA